MLFDLDRPGRPRARATSSPAPRASCSATASNSSAARVRPGAISGVRSGHGVHTTTCQLGSVRARGGTMPRRKGTTAFGVDIGGSGIKGAIVDLDRGDLATERVKYLTPHPSTPQAVADVVARLVREAGWTGELGCDVPGGDQARGGAERRERGQELDRHRRRQGLHRHHRLRRHRAQRRRRGRARRGPLRRGQGRGRRGHPAHLRHRDRQRAAAGRQAGAQHRARPPGAGRARRGEAARPRRRRTTRACRTSSGPSGCSATCGTWRSCSPRTCSWSAAGSARTRRSGCRCWTCGPR